MPEVDFWRGFALVVALIDHAPKNILDFFTPQNFGLSDAADGFIFLSFSSLLGIATLGHQQNYSSVLPVYVLLMLWAPISCLAQFDRGESIAGLRAACAALSGSST